MDKTTSHPLPLPPSQDQDVSSKGRGDAAKTLAPVELAPHTPTLTEAQLQALKANSFQKGKSGNPGGRPKAEISLKALCRVSTKEAVDKLVQLMRTAKDQKVQLRAAEVLLDRGYGKAAQAHLEPEDAAMPGDEMSNEELDKALDA